MASCLLLAICGNPALTARYNNMLDMTDDKGKRIYFACQADAEANLHEQGFAMPASEYDFWTKYDSGYRIAADIRYNAQGYFVKIGIARA
jgi:hypothetical protein